jgi:response regulator of citrate/malate metabolism
MLQTSTARPRVLIVEDEFLVALDIEQSMIALGFDSCGLAPNDTKARSLAMSGHPDLILMDVCLEGGREGIESGRWLREVCGVPVVFLTASTDEETLGRIQERVPGAPVLSKLGYRHRLGNILEEVRLSPKAH